MDFGVANRLSSVRAYGSETPKAERSFYPMSRRKQYDSQFKAQVALEAIKNQRTLAQIASE